MEKKENIFTKFINFIKKIFGNEVPKKIAEQNTVVEQHGLKINKEENQELLNLQEKYEKNEIELSEMSGEELHNLNLLYKRQITELEKKIDNKRTELNVAKLRVDSYSANV